MLREEVQTRRFNVEEYHRMAEAGILGEDDRLELVDGELVEMAPIGSRHLACVVALNHLLVEASEGRWFVSVQNPVRLGERDEPEPDLSLLKGRPDPAAPGPPGPDDLLVVVEVSDTTLSYDRNVKLPLYAAARIPEAWIVDLQDRKVEVYADPGAGPASMGGSAQGYQTSGYHVSSSYAPGETIVSETIAGLSLPVDEVLG